MRIASSKRSEYVTSKSDIYFLGLTIVVGGQIIYWARGFQSGFWPFFIAVVVTGMGYLCLVCCLAEMTSMMPFAGGSFGYVRCTLGPVIGYLVGCCEAIEYILYVASAVIELGNLITILTGLTASFEPLYWMAFYIISMGIQIRGGSVFWRFNALMAIVPVLLIVWYCLISLPTVDFAHYAIHNDDHNGFGGSWHDTLEVMPLAAWFFVGVEAMTLSCDDIARPSHTVPVAMVAVMITLLITSISIILTTASQFPGTIGLVETVLPLSPGYNSFFQNKLTSPILALFALPGVFGTAFGFMFAYGRQVSAMARSGLLPQPLSSSLSLSLSLSSGGADDTNAHHRTPPIPALLAGSVIGGSILLLLWELFPNDQATISTRLFGLCMLGSCCVYVAIFLSFLTARRYLAKVPRVFTSPLGIMGAVYGVMVFTAMAFALAFFQQDDYAALIIFSITMLIALGYYYLIARKKEFLSLQEQEQFMKAYLMRAEEAEGKGDSSNSTASSSSSKTKTKTRNSQPSIVKQQQQQQQVQIRAANLVISRSFASKKAFLERVIPMPQVDNNGHTVPLTAEEQAERLRWERLADQLFASDGHQGLQPRSQSNTGVDKPVQVVVLPSAHTRHTAAFRWQTDDTTNHETADHRVKLIETDTAVEIIPGWSYME